MNRLLLLTFSLLIFHASATELKGKPEDLRQFLAPSENIVVIKGDGRETAYSDKAIVNLIVTTKEDQLSDALKANTALRQMIKSSLTAQGVKASDINNSKFSSSPQFGWFGSSPSSYQVVNRIAINIFDEKALQAIAKIADKNEAVELSNTRYEHTKKAEFLMKVKQKAMADIMKQKSFYEKSLGVKLKTKRFRDANVSFGATQGARELSQKITITGSRRKRTSSNSVPISYQEMDTSVAQSFDEVEYNATIFVDFIIVTQP